MRDGYSITRHGPAIALAGKLCLKLHRTTPLLPCALVTLPQIARYLLPFVTFLALYTYTTLPKQSGRHEWVHPEEAVGAVARYSAADFCA